MRGEAPLLFVLKLGLALVSERGGEYDAEHDGRTLWAGATLRAAHPSRSIT